MQPRIHNPHPQLLNQSLPSKPENKSGNQNLQGIMEKNNLKKNINTQEQPHLNTVRRIAKKHTRFIHRPDDQHGAGVFHSGRGGAGFSIKRGAGINIQHILTQSPAHDMNPTQPPNNQHGAGVFHSIRGGAGFSIKRGRD